VYIQAAISFVSISPATAAAAVAIRFHFHLHCEASVVLELSVYCAHKSSLGWNWDGKL